MSFGLTRSHLNLSTRLGWVLTILCAKLIWASCLGIVLTTLVWVLNWDFLDPIVPRCIFSLAVDFHGRGGHYVEVAPSRIQWPRSPQGCQQGPRSSGVPWRAKGVTAAKLPLFFFFSFFFYSIYSAFLCCLPHSTPNGLFVCLLVKQ